MKSVLCKLQMKRNNIRNNVFLPYIYFKLVILYINNSIFDKTTKYEFIYPKKKGTLLRNVQDKYLIVYNDTKFYISSI